jgi:hypothetical protein
VKPPSVEGTHASHVLVKAAHVLPAGAGQDLGMRAMYGLFSSRRYPPCWICASSRSSGALDCPSQCANLWPKQPKP